MGNKDFLETWVNIIAAKLTNVQLGKGKYEEYFSKLDAESRFSSEFKDLIVRIFKEDGSDRPTVAQIRAHPWMQREKDE